jgi:hypothetical protein
MPPYGNRHSAVHPAADTAPQSRCFRFRFHCRLTGLSRNVPTPTWYALIHASPQSYLLLDQSQKGVARSAITPSGEGPLGVAMASTVSMPRVVITGCPGAGRRRCSWSLQQGAISPSKSPPGLSLQRGSQAVPVVDRTRSLSPAKSSVGTSRSTAGSSTLPTGSSLIVGSSKQLAWFTRPHRFLQKN